MKYSTVHFPQDLLASQGAASGFSQMWMLIRRWRVLVRRCLLVLIPATFIFVCAAFLLVLLPVLRIPRLRPTLYPLVCLEQVAWVVAVGLTFYVYTKRRQWLPGLVSLMISLLIIRGAMLSAQHLGSIWCSRPSFGRQHIFSVPFDVPCANGTCILHVDEKEKPKICAVMYSFYNGLGLEHYGAGVVAKILFAQHIIQVIFALFIIIHALEDLIRLSF